MPPHPGFFMKKSATIDMVYLFELISSADYELMLRVLEVHNLKHIYISKTITSMRVVPVIHP